MPDNEQDLIEKAGRVLSSQNAQAIMDAFNATAGATNKLMELLKRAGIEQIAEEAPAEGDAEATTEDDTPPADEEAPEADTEEKMVVRPSQKEVNYTPVSTKKGEACSNCRWFSATGIYGDGGAYCHLIDNWPDDIVSNGYCDRHEAIPTVDATENPVPVVIVQQEAKAQKEYTSVIQRVKDALRKTVRPVEDAGSAFIIFKGVDGKPKWFARHTNNFEDLEGDIFTEKAHDKTIARVDAKLVPMPYLTFWHLQGTEHGRATKIMRDGHVVMSMGDFDDTPFALKCLKYYQKNRGKIKLSLGAYVPKWARSVAPDVRGKLYTDYNALHITTLPPVIAKAANPFTTFSEDMVMALKPEQKELLIKEFGKEDADRIERENETLNKTIEQLVQYKDFADLVTKTEDKTQPTTSDKTAASLFVDMLESQALVVKTAEGVAKHQTDVDAKIEAIEKQYADELKKANDTITALRTDLDALTKKTLGAAPRRASQDSKTALTEEQAAAVQKEIPKEFDPVWGNLGVPKDA